VRFVEGREEFAALLLAGAEGALNDVITVLDFTAMEAVFSS
jgi:hypothetical protein